MFSEFVEHIKGGKLFFEEDTNKIIKHCEAPDAMEIHFVKSNTNPSDLTSSFTYQIKHSKTLIQSTNNLSFSCNNELKETKYSFINE